MLPGASNASLYANLLGYPIGYLLGQPIRYRKRVALKLTSRDFQDVLAARAARDALIGKQVDPRQSDIAQSPPGRGQAALELVL
jgi:hypothetical protein